MCVSMKARSCSNPICAIDAGQERAAAACQFPVATPRLAKYSTHAVGQLSPESLQSCTRSQVPIMAKRLHHNFCLSCMHPSETGAVGVTDRWREL